jgi:macrophage erythroblast attacher
MSTSKLNIDGIMLFEQPFARVPYENYRKVFRATQRNIERELGAVLTTANELGKRAKAGVQSSQDASKSVDSMIGRVENLKRKVHR